MKPIYIAYPGRDYRAKIVFAVRATCNEYHWYVYNDECILASGRAKDVDKARAECDAHGRES